LGLATARFLPYIPRDYRASGASAAYQISQIYGGGLIPIIAGLLLNTYGIHRAYIYIGLFGHGVSRTRYHRNPEHAGHHEHRSGGYGAANLNIR
jgi:hypothetical protein